MESDIHRSQEHDSKEIMFQEQKSLISSIKTKMANAFRSHRICRIPDDEFYKRNEEKYVPLMVSIGPFHRGRPELKAVEDQKWQFLSTLLSRKLNTEETMEKCIQTLKHLEERARKCYVEEILMGSDAFIEMMLLDGCFIIELFQVSCCKGLRRREDPFLATYEVFSRLRRDLVLLENQIPFIVLRHLFALVHIPKHCPYSLIQLAFRFFKKTVPDDPQYVEGRFGQEIHHLLDLIHQSFIPMMHKVHNHPCNMHQVQLQTSIANVIELHENGITIRWTKSKSFLDIDFLDGVLKIPTFRNNDLIGVVLGNLIAMENCCDTAIKYVTSYVFLMRNLIQSNDDAKFLYKRGILDKGLGEVEDFVTLFEKNSIRPNANDFYYRGLCEKINKYGKVIRSVWYARKVKYCVKRYLQTEL